MPWPLAPDARPLNSRELHIVFVKDIAGEIS